MWKYYYSKLSKGIDIGYSPKPKFYDADLVHSLKNNIAQFSAFKETSFKQTLESLLIKDGKLVPWSEYKKEALGVSDTFERYLKTEYHQTVATANMAEKWQGWQRNKDLYPNLKYVTVGDKRVRLKHEQWDGLILPIDHPWWLEHLPPNDWGCRCDAVQTDEEVTKDIPSDGVKKGFDNNPAVSGKIYKSSTYEKGLDKVDRKEAENNANKFFSKLPEVKARNKKLRLEIRTWSKLNLLTKKLQHPDVNKVFGFSIGGIKHYINQPYKHQFNKLTILQGFEEGFHKLNYIGANSHKAKGLNTISHIFEIEVNKEISWLIFREHADGSVVFYAISDNKNVIKGVKK